MPTSDEYLIAANREQSVSESDGFTEDRYRQFGGYLPLGEAKVLDVGCGIGRGGAVLRSLFPDMKLVGMDCVPERVEVIPRAIYADAVCAFADNLPFSDRSFDAIVAGEFLEHVPPEKIEATLCEFFRILKLKGQLILTTPNPGYLKNKLKGLSVMLDPSHVTQHYPSSLRSRLKNVGFSSIRIQGSGRVSKLLGTYFPLSLYGSYLARAIKW
jgi:ubiquinone/menaquinone biosynthesis C-methylase UbiE